MELIETSTFTRQITALLSDEEYRGFQSRIAAKPELGALIKGGGGIRKARLAVGSRGKSGGPDVIYYWAVRKDVVLLLYAYSKIPRRTSLRVKFRSSPKSSKRSSAIEEANV